MFSQNYFISYLIYYIIIYENSFYFLEGFTNTKVKNRLVNNVKE
jgi:hypothetical protein